MAESGQDKASGVHFLWSQIIDFNKTVVTLGSALLTVSVAIAIPVLTSSTIVITEGLKYAVTAALGLLALVVISATTAILYAVGYIQAVQQDQSNIESSPPVEHTDTTGSTDGSKAQSQNAATNPERQTKGSRSIDFTNWTLYLIIAAVIAVTASGIGVLWFGSPPSSSNGSKRVLQTVLDYMPYTTNVKSDWQINNVTEFGKQRHVVVTNLTTGAVFSVTVDASYTVISPTQIITP